jgi:hypothetical protein
MTNQTVLALYDDRASAQQVLEELRAAGYGSEFSLSDGGSSSSAASGVSTASGGSIRSSSLSDWGFESRVGVDGGKAGRNP